MADMLNTALSAITSYQRALATTSHNIANANTEGYSRQTVSLATNTPQSFGFGSIGTGVNVASINRVYDQFVVDQMRSSSTSYNGFKTFNELAGQIDGILSDPNTGISSALTGFFDSLQEVADAPSSLSARQLLLSEADSLVSRLKTVDDQLNQINSEINTRINMSVQDINGLTSRIAELNETIRDIAGRNNDQPPNDLIDQRDQALFELSSYLNISVLEQDDHTVTVSTSGGQGLVLGGRSFELSITKNEFNPTQLEVALENTSGLLEISRSISGGTLGGALDFRSDVLETTRASLGQLTYGLASSFNEQHQAGMDLSGNLGGEFFTVPEPEVAPSSSNSGAGTVDVSIGDIATLEASNYQLRFDGANYQLLDAQSGQTVPMTGSGTAGDPFEAAGLSIVVGGAPDAGDTFLIRPTAHVTGNLGVAVTRPGDIAAASPTRAFGDTGNNGDAVVESSRVVDVDDPQLLADAEISFLDATTYQINGAGSFAYTSGEPITVNGTEVVISGSPQVGDRFFVESNAGGVGDNRNARLLAGIQDGGIFDGGDTSVMNAASNLLADVAVATRSSSIHAKSQQALLEQNVARRESVSGVNLEEEAANMLRFQQAFQAAAQAVSTSNTIFQTMLNAFGR